MNIINTTLLAALTIVGLSGCEYLAPARDAMVGGPRINENVYQPRNAGVEEPRNVVPAIIPRPCRPAPEDTPVIGNALQLKANTDVGTRIVDLGSDTPNYARDPFEEFAVTVSGASLNLCVDAMKGLIDMRWRDFEHALNGSLSTSNFLVDAAVTGLTTSIPLVAPGTKSVLGAIATGLLGTRKNFDEDILYSYSIKTIVQQMYTDRAAVGAVIEHHLDGSGTAYRNLYQAESDLFDYANAGSWDHAMASLATNVAAQTAACQARLRDEKMGNTTDAGSQTSTATDPCNAPPPPKPAMQPISITFTGTGITPGQDAVLDQAAALIKSGVIAGTITGAVVTGEAAATETDPAASAKARADAVIAALTDKTKPSRNIPSDDVSPDDHPNLAGTAIAVISFQSPLPTPSGQQDTFGTPAPKTLVAPPPAAEAAATSLAMEFADGSSDLSENDIAKLTDFATAYASAVTAGTASMIVLQGVYVGDPAGKTIAAARAEAVRAALVTIRPDATITVLGPGVSTKLDGVNLALGK